MGNEVLTKLDWYEYYSADCFQKRFVYIDTVEAGILLFSVNILSEFISVFGDLLSISNRADDIYDTIVVLRRFTSSDVIDRLMLVGYNSMFMLRNALCLAKRVVSTNDIQCFTTRNLRAKIDNLLCKFDPKWWSRDIKHTEQLPEGVLIKYQKQNDSCSLKVEVILEGKRNDDESDWVKIKTCELDPGSTVDITKETKKYVKTFKEFRFVRRIVDKTLVRSGISLFDPENDIEYKIEE